MNLYDTYVSTEKAGMSDREIEAAALTKAAQLLKSCQDNWDAPDRPAKLAEAVEMNQKLWSIFEASLLRSDNPLPVSMRRDILGLAAFIDKRLFEVLAHPMAQKLTIVVQVNLNLAAGLREGANGGRMEGEPSHSRRGEPVWA